MDNKMDLSRLKEFFDLEDIEWKPIAISKNTGKGLAAAYVTNRAIMDRLDEVCGPENWKNEFQAGPDGGVICGLSIQVGDQWITKWDGAENTDIEPVKGGLSSSMRRAAVQWGIGRYLYRLPAQWVPVDERSRFKQPPVMPEQFLPGKTAGDTNTRVTFPRVEEPTPQIPAKGESGASRPAPRRNTANSSREQVRRTPGKDVKAADYFMPGTLPK